MTVKENFANRVMDKATTLSALLNDLDDIVDVWVDRTYGSGGANAITDSDLTALGITAANLNSFVTMAIQIKNLINNISAVQGFYNAALSVLRRDYR